MDDSGVVLLFRDKAYLHPEKVVDLVRRAVPLALAPDNDTRQAEFKQLQEKKEEIDKLAHKQVRRVLWTGLGFFMLQVGIFFRLTFWEFSWDVMEPIAFFTTTSGLLVGYAYFVITSRDPTYQDFMERMFESRRRKLCVKHGFNMENVEAGVQLVTGSGGVVGEFELGGGIMAAKSRFSSGGWRMCGSNPAAAVKGGGKATAPETGRVGAGSTNGGMRRAGGATAD
ncbi:hypothetical protein TRIUR3_35419 [Triticum urartu]|uniref:Calcium uniporter protein C-terminal domain-containing protein n=1 Tax=Triticum urartu TaxID=4572 RepID=M7ZZ78_TRIUA|nr:hypothetical protein TRIUR3_35419 [Triticum urartu]